MSIKAKLFDQFREPRGLLGRLAGRFMSSRASNQQRSVWTVELLELKPGDRVLELGYGPGLGIAAVLDRLEAGEVVGIDHSATMQTMSAETPSPAHLADHTRVIGRRRAGAPRVARHVRQDLLVQRVVVLEGPGCRPPPSARSPQPGRHHGRYDPAPQLGRKPGHRHEGRTQNRGAARGGGLRRHPPRGPRARPGPCGLRPGYDSAEWRELGEHQRHDRPPVPRRRWPTGCARLSRWSRSSSSVTRCWAPARGHRDERNDRR